MAYGVPSRLSRLPAVVTGEDRRLANLALTTTPSTTRR
jgi:hypothetical protein